MTTTVKSAIGHSSGAISVQPFPLSSMPRTIRMACVVGKMLPSDLRPDRHAAEREHEARQQERGHQGELGELHRLHLVRRHGREGDAEREIAGDEDAKRASSNRTEPRIGRAKKIDAATRMRMT